jgi:hypothetical protein
LQAAIQRLLHAPIRLLVRIGQTGKIARSPGNRGAKGSGSAKIA